MKKIVILSVLAVMAVCSVACFATVKNKTKAPDFTLPIAGKEKQKVTLSKQTGYVLLVDFWATWCPPCRKEIPELMKLKKDYKGKPFKLIGIAADDEESDVVAFIRKNNLDYTVLFDPRVKTTGESYEIEAFPTTYIIDKEGKVAASFVGFRGDEIKYMKKVIDKCLEDK